MLADGGMSAVNSGARGGKPEREDEGNAGRESGELVGEACGEGCGEG